MPLIRLKRLLVGEPLSNLHAAEERIPKWKALSTLSSDALSSVTYATDAILIALAAFSANALAWSGPIAIGIVVLLAIITASYRQTIDAYPNGGGAYTVARENLGKYPGLVAGASLLIDYALTVAVSVSAGVENLTSAFPNLHEYTISICFLVIILITIMNLRGIRESATIFSFPTYFFIFSILALIATGLWKSWHGEVQAAAPIVHAMYPAVPMILILRAFASGCAALAGVEAISNGIPIFREPSPQNAKITLVWMAVILGTLFLGITGLAHILQIVPHNNETLISLLGRSVFGDSLFYYFLQGSTAMILFLAANTSYSGFPRLASLLAKDRYLPRQLASQGDRLVFSNGVMGLSIIAGCLIWLFHAETIHLLPLYAVGVFLSFTLSQLGMVVHHKKSRHKGWRGSLLINATGAVVTFIVLMDIAVTKFLHGAWIVVLAIPVFILLFRKIYDHYLDVGRELNLMGTEAPAKFRKVKHTVVIPVSGIHRGVLDAVEYAQSISEDVRACYVDLNTQATERMESEWKRWVPGVPFVVLKSPYRSVVEPLIRYIDDVEQICHDDLVTVVIPEFVTTKWWHRLLHNHTAIFIRAALAFRKGKVVTSVRYHLKGI
jgi:amino acid transporter